MGRLNKEIMCQRFGFHPGEVSHDMFARNMVWYDQFGSYIMDRDLGLRELVSLRVGLESDEFVILVGHEWVLGECVKEGSIESIVQCATYMVTQSNQFRIESVSVGIPYTYQGVTFDVLGRQEALERVLAMRT